MKQEVNGLLGGRDEEDPLGQMERNESHLSLSSAPLTDEEFKALQQTLRESGHADSSFTRLLQQPSTSAQATHPTGAEWPASDHEAYTMTRIDSLDTNPGFVNPHEVSNVGTPLFQVKVENVNPTKVLFNTDQHTVTVIEQAPVPDPDVLGAWGDLDDELKNNWTAAAPSPTSANPATQDWPGNLNFTISFPKLTQSTKNKTWDYSSSLNKLFIDMNKYVQIDFGLAENPPDGLLVRAVPIYAVPSSIRDPVKRCPNHASPADASNNGFPQEFRDHLIRVNHDAAYYEEDEESHRLSVVVPLDRPQVGTTSCNRLFKFMCLGSDVGGINRRPVQVIFTLEYGPGNVVGRRTIDVRICSCPKRDRQQEESKLTDAQRLADGLARSNSIVFAKPQGSKKRKLDKDAEEMVLVPVAKADFEKLNEFAEAAMIVRRPEKAAQIKAERQRLLEACNKRTKPKPQ